MTYAVIISGAVAALASLAFSAGALALNIGALVGVWRLHRSMTETERRQAEHRERVRQVEAQARALWGGE